MGPQAVPDPQPLALGSVLPPEAGAGSPYIPHSHLTHTQPHTLHSNHVHTCTCPRPHPLLKDLRLTMLLHSHEVSRMPGPLILSTRTPPAPWGHTSLTGASHPSDFQQPIRLLPPPTFTSQVGKWHPDQRQLSTRGWVGRGGPCQPLLHCPINHSVAVQLGIPAPSATRSPRDNGIVSAGRGRLGPGLRR